MFVNVIIVRKRSEKMTQMKHLNIEKERGWSVLNFKKKVRINTLPSLEPEHESGEYIGTNNERKKAGVFNKKKKKCLNEI